MTLRIGIIGAGAIGGYFGAVLAEAGMEVVVLARGKNRDVLATDGLTVLSETGDITVKFAAVSDDPAELGPVDVILFTVKGQDTDQAAEDMRPMVGPETEIISLQNGLYGIDVLAEKYGVDHVSPGITYTPAVVEKPGLIRKTGTLTRTIFGPYHPRDMSVHEQIAAACKAGGVDIKALREPMGAIWEKFVVLAPFHIIGGLTRLPVGGWIGTPETRDLFLRAMQEVCAVGRARGADISPDAADKKLHYARTTTNPATRASMLEDLERGKRLELDSTVGWLCREGEKLGVPTPIHAMAYALLLPHKNGV
ncbi:ketopantoate reductase family protein [Sneathiella sp.]|uniref:ketopantoate reductase family protein n=1 Tax=Sneathiella sp. TaxID=1964365 RepID=UPI003565AB59